jgi:hypothetical protein
MGLLMGLGFGVALVALLEYRDTSIKTDDDVLVSLSLPVLAVIPQMMNAADRHVRRRRRTLWSGAAAAALLLLVLAAGLAWQFGLLDRWVR